MYNKRFLVMDPGGRNFACNFIHKGSSLWMGYHPTIVCFEINDIFWYDLFKKTSESLLKRCEGLIIERFISRQANARVSTEKLNLMIGTLISQARDMNKDVIPKTSSAWKRKVPYDVCLDKAKRLGFLNKDKHFVDTILMYSVCCGIEEDYFSLLKKGRRAYERFRVHQKFWKEVEKQPEARQKEIREQLKRIRFKQKLLVKGIGYEKDDRGVGTKGGA
jgi:hypothetical protein